MSCLALEYRLNRSCSRGLVPSGSDVAVRSINDVVGLAVIAGSKVEASPLLSLVHKSESKPPLSNVPKYPSEILRTVRWASLCGILGWMALFRGLPISVLERQDVHIPVYRLAADFVVSGGEGVTQFHNAGLLFFRWRRLMTSQP